MLKCKRAMAMSSSSKVMSGPTVPVMLAIPEPEKAFGGCDCSLVHVKQHQPLVAIKAGKEASASPCLDFATKWGSEDIALVRSLFAEVDGAAGIDDSLRVSFKNGELLETAPRVFALTAFFVAQPVFGVVFMDSLFAFSEGDKSGKASMFLTGCGTVPNHAEESFEVADSVHVLPGVPESAGIIYGLPKIKGVRGDRRVPNHGNMLCVVPAKFIIDLCNEDPDLFVPLLRATHLGTCTERCMRRPSVSVYVDPKRDLRLR